MKQLWTLAAVLAVAGFASAAPLVDLDFGTTSFDGSVNSPRAELGGSSDGQIDFDLTQPFLTTSDYVTAPQNGLFYGGVAVFTSSGGSSVVTAQGKPGSPDYFQTGRGFGLSGSDMEFATAFVWKKADFLSGFGSAQANLETMSVTVNGVPDSNTVTRWMVQIGSQFYVSQESSTGAGTFSTNDFSSSNWAPIDLASDMLADPGVFTEVAMNDVQAVGFYAQVDATGGAPSGPLYRFNSFSATAVPEPTSIALLGLGGLATVIRRRRSH